MAMCEDFPACGHELGCCPDYDEETGAQLNMKCVCGAVLPIGASSSICAGCMDPPPGHPDHNPWTYERQDYDPGRDMIDAAFEDDMETDS